MVNGKGTTERKERKRAEREDRILRAAEQLILAKGFSETSVDDIAAKADVSKGAVYLHYRTKDDIYFSIATKALTIMRDMFLKAAKQEAIGLEKFKAIGYSFYEYTKKYPDYANILYDVSAPKLCHLLASEEHCQSLSDEIGQIMISSIELGKKDESIRPDVDPMAAAIIISSSLQGLLKTVLSNRERMDEMGMDERYLVEYSIDLYGRSLINSSCAINK